MLPYLFVSIVAISRLEDLTRLQKCRCERSLGYTDAEPILEQFVPFRQWDGRAQDFYFKDVVSMLFKETSQSRESAHASFGSALYDSDFGVYQR
jgi:hypothetical protein